MNFSFHAFRSAALTLLSVAAAASTLSAQSGGLIPIQVQTGPFLNKESYDLPRNTSVGNSTLGGTITSGARCNQKRAGFNSPLGWYYDTRYLQASGEVFANLDARLLGRSARAAEASFSASVEDARWDEYWDPASGQWLPTNFRPGAAAGARSILRVAGIDVDIQTTSGDLNMNVSRTYPLFSVSSPGFSLGPATVSIHCNVQVTAGYWAYVTPRLGPVHGVTDLSFRGNANAQAMASARLQVSVPGLLSSGVSVDIRPAGVVNVTDMTVNGSGITGQNMFGISSVRLYARAWVKYGVGLVSRTDYRTLYDETPYGGWSETIGF